ncbi:hypothetical protein L2E82_25757 [Cichorium intybus]|uniref:Uncharacterized protein n=1 Tax=Cichorium intybus TaxID=13427 RepID=A0ACB9E4P2_CICIN|nr:hypothetical protein L2E82_25757 [Cichorium intybus]
MSIDLLVDVPVFGLLVLPLKNRKEIPMPFKPDVDVDRIKSKKFCYEQLAATLHWKLKDNNDFVLVLNTLGYEAWLLKDSIFALWDMIRRKRVGYIMKGKSGMFIVEEE